MQDSIATYKNMFCERLAATDVFFWKVIYLWKRIAGFTPHGRAVALIADLVVTATCVAFTIQLEWILGSARKRLLPVKAEGTAIQHQTLGGSINTATN